MCITRAPLHPGSADSERFRGTLLSSAILFRDLVCQNRLCGSAASFSLWAASWRSRHLLPFRSSSFPQTYLGKCAVPCSPRKPLRRGRVGGVGTGRCKKLEVGIAVFLWVEEIGYGKRGESKSGSKHGGENIETRQPVPSLIPGGRETLGAPGKPFATAGLASSWGII